MCERPQLYAAPRYSRSLDSQRRARPDSTHIPSAESTVGDVTSQNYVGKQLEGHSATRF